MHPEEKSRESELVAETQGEGPRWGWGEASQAGLGRAAHRPPGPSRLLPAGL